MIKKWYKSTSVREYLAVIATIITAIAAVIFIIDSVLHSYDTKFDNLGSDSLRTVQPDTVRLSIAKDKPEYGAIYIKIYPPGARISIDGKIPMDSSVINLEQGNHLIEARKEGYEEFKTNVEILPGKTTNIELRLIKSYPKQPDSTKSVVERTNIDKIIAELRDAMLTFNAPDTMIVGETRQILLLMSMKLPKVSLQKQLKTGLLDTTKIGRIYLTTIKATEKMVAHLTGLGFTVKPITEIAQLVKGKGSTRWEWIIKADESGMQILYLTLNAHIDYKGEQITQTIQTFRQEIFVYVRPTTIILKLIEKHIAWIAGFFSSVITLFLGYYLAILKERKKKPKDEKPLIVKP